MNNLKFFYTYEGRKYGCGKRNTPTKKMGFWACTPVTFGPWITIVFKKASYIQLTYLNLFFIFFFFKYFVYLFLVN